MKHLLAVAFVLALSTTAQAGIIFSRKVEKAAGVSFDLVFAKGCSAKDTFGSNNCNFKWGDQLDGNITAALSKPLQQGSAIDVALRIDRFLPFKQVCPVCGGKCEVDVPVVGKKFDIPLPPCPISVAKISKSFNEELPKHAPIDIKVSVDGVVTLLDEAKKPVLQMKISAEVAETDEVTTLH